MAVNDDVLDELVALYRQSANETAPRRVDARVLRAADTQASVRRLRHAWPWLGLAMAASLAMWLTVYRGTSMPDAPLHDEATRAYLLHMDINPPGRGDRRLPRNDAYFYSRSNSDTLENSP